jgi:hypothetical protein
LRRKNKYAFDGKRKQRKEGMVPKEYQISLPAKKRNMPSSSWKMSKESSLIPAERIERSILLIRGQKVILDKDLARLYQVSTTNLNKAVSRNLGRFPEDFMFQLSKEELNNLIFQFGTSSWGGIRKVPRAFTEQGVAMISGVLHSKRAVSVNIYCRHSLP